MINIATGKNSLIIQYSLLDCLLCNANLINIAKVEASEKIILFKEEYKNDQGVKNLVPFLEKHNIKLFFSDLLHAQWGQSISSKIFVVNESSEILFTSDLKSVQLSDLRIHFTEQETRMQSFGEVVLPKWSIARYTASKIYILDIRNGMVLIVDKRKPGFIEDTIDLANEEYVKDIYRMKFNGLAEYHDMVTAKAENPMLPFRTSYYNLIVASDSIFVISNHQYIVRNGDEKGVRNFSAIALLVNGRYITNFPINRDVKICADESDCYTVIETQLLRYAGDFYIPIKKHKSSEKNLLLAKAAINKQGLYAAKLLPFQMPTEHSEGASYRILNFIQDGEIVAFSFGNQIFNLKSGTTTTIPIFLAPNNFRPEILKSKNIEIESEILDISQNGRNLQVLYKSNDSLRLATFELNGQEYTLSKSVLLNTESNKKREKLAITKGGYYSYSRELQQFEYTPQD